MLRQAQHERLPQASTADFRFNEAYKRQNKSAVIAELMREAVERAERKQHHHVLALAFFALRAQMPPVSAEDVQAAHDELRQS